LWNIFPGCSKRKRASRVIRGDQKFLIISPKNSFNFPGGAIYYKNGSQAEKTIRIYCTMFARTGQIFQENISPIIAYLNNRPVENTFEYASLAK